jgi:hypothetical protein
VKDLFGIDRAEELEIREEAVDVVLWRRGVYDPDAVENTIKLIKAYRALKCRSPGATAQSTRRGRAALSDWTSRS